MTLQTKRTTVLEQFSPILERLLDLYFKSLHYKIERVLVCLFYWRCDNKQKHLNRTGFKSKNLRTA